MNESDWKCHCCKHSMNAFLNFCSKCATPKGSTIPTKRLNVDTFEEENDRWGEAVNSRGPHPSALHSGPDIITLHQRAGGHLGPTDGSSAMCTDVPTLLAVIQELAVQATVIEGHVIHLSNELSDAKRECAQLKKKWLETVSQEPQRDPAVDTTDRSINPLEKEMIDRLRRRENELKLDIERTNRESNELRTRLYEIQKKRNIRTTIIDSLILGKPTHNRNVYALRPHGEEALTGYQDTESAPFEMLLIALRSLTPDQDACLVQEGYFQMVKGFLQEARNQVMDVEEVRALGLSDRCEGIPRFSLESAVACGMRKVGGSFQFLV